MFDEPPLSEVELKVTEVFIDDVGKGLARFDPEDVKALGAALGDVVEDYWRSTHSRQNFRDFPRTCWPKTGPDRRLHP